MSVLSQLLVKVQHDKAQETMPLQVVKGSGTTLLGRDWLQKFRLDWKTIFKIHIPLTLQEVLDSHKEVFSGYSKRLQSQVISGETSEATVP